MNTISDPSPPEPQPHAQGDVGKNLVIVAFLCFLIFCGTRSLILKDNRFGWGMFNHQVSYVVTYEWVLRDGSTIPCATDNLHGKALKKLGRDTRHTMLYGIGALRRWIGTYLEHLYEDERPTNAVRVTASLSYAVNTTNFESDPKQTETFSYP
jgi:hypothetical protein